VKKKTQITNKREKKKTTKTSKDPRLGVLKRAKNVKTENN